MAADIGNVCEDCANAWAQIYLAANTEIIYNLVEPADCEECEGEKIIVRYVEDKE